MWCRGVTKAGLPEGFRFHDVRHTGNARSDGEDRGDEDDGDAGGGPARA
jgi:hypothetical protein